VTRKNPEEDLDLNTTNEESGSGPSWGVEVEPTGPGNSVFYSARRVVLGDDYVEIQLLDGKYMTLATGQVRKVLSMRANGASGYTGKTPSDEIY
jgi:hypothetical protein